MRVQKEHTDFTQVKKAVDSVLNMDREQLETGLGISTADKYMEISKDEILNARELGKIKLEILTGMIRYYNKIKNGEV
jgi:hypothetical protein